MASKAGRVYEFFIKESIKTDSLLYHPSENTMHNHTIVSGGGLIFGSFALLLISFWAASDASPVLGIYVCCAVTILLLGFRDDVDPLSIKLRLGLQVLCSLAISYQLPVPEILGEIGVVPWIIFSTFFLTACINLYNFFDGIDGLATAQGITFLLFSVVLGLMSTGMEQQTTFAMLLALPLIGFCKWNWNPARLFMGDAGSTFLGFSFGFLILWAAGVGGEQPMSFINLCALMMPCFFECSRVIIQRIVKKERFWTTHHNHTFQRLVKTGQSHHKVALLYLYAAVSIGCFVTLLTAGIPYMESIQRLLVGAIPCLLLLTFCLSVESKSGDKLKKNIFDSIASSANSFASTFSFDKSTEANDELDNLFSEVMAENEKLLSDIDGLTKTEESDKPEDKNVISA